MQALLNQQPFEPAAISLPDAFAGAGTVHLCGELPVTASLATRHTADRPALEQFIQEVFYRVHRAKVTHFLPVLLSLRDSNADLRAVCGLRHAQDEPLFLEQYFAQPIEAVLSQQAGMAISRHEILEVGNLAILKPACIRSLLASITVYLHQTQAEWVVFTAVNSLKNALIKLNMPLQLLGEASLASLPAEEHTLWGRYYDARPQVIAIRRMR